MCSEDFCGQERVVHWFLGKRAAETLLNMNLGSPEWSKGKHCFCSVNSKDLVSAGLASVLCVSSTLLLMYSSSHSQDTPSRQQTCIRHGQVKSWLQGMLEEWSLILIAAGVSCVVCGRHWLLGTAPSMWFYRWEAYCGKCACVTSCSANVMSYLTTSLTAVNVPTFEEPFLRCGGLLAWVKMCVFCGRDTSGESVNFQPFWLS